MAEPTRNPNQDYTGDEHEITRHYQADWVDDEPRYSDAYGRSQRYDTHNQNAYGDQGFGFGRGNQPATDFEARQWRDYGSDQGNRYYAQRSNARPQESHAGRGPKGYQRSDERLLEEVCECLMWDDAIDASEIEVSVQGGEVTLEGTVDSRQTKRMAEAVIEGSVRGVKDIHNRLRVARQEQITQANRM